MPLSHENLRVYRASIQFIAWSQPFIEKMPAKISARDQLERASTSIALNIAEGNAKFSNQDRLRFWQIAQGSAFECGACLDVLVARGVLPAVEAEKGKEQLNDIVNMIVGLRKRFGTVLKEEMADYGRITDQDHDHDQDHDYNPNPNPNPDRDRDRDPDRKI